MREVFSQVHSELGLWNPTQTVEPSTRCMQHPGLIRDEGGVLTSSQRIRPVRDYSNSRTFNYIIIIVPDCLFFAQSSSGNVFLWYSEIPLRCWIYQKYNHVEDVHLAFCSFSIFRWSTYAHGLLRVLGKKHLTLFSNKKQVSLQQNIWCRTFQISSETIYS